MIDIKPETVLIAFGDNAQNVSVVEDLNWTPAKPGMRRFMVHPTNLTSEDTQYIIELSSNQEAAQVTHVKSGDQRVFLCANCRSAEELFGDNILPAAAAYMEN